MLFGRMADNTWRLPCLEGDVWCSVCPEYSVVLSDFPQTMSHERFTQLYAEHEKALYGFVYSLMPDRNAADDVIQAAMTQIWEHLDDYDTVRPFFPWACRFAYRQVLMHRRREGRTRRFFSEATLELLSQDGPPDCDWEESRLAALQSCLSKLSDRQRELVHHRYTGDLPLTELAPRLGRSVSALYKSLERTRKSIADCVSEKLAEGAR